MNKIQKAIHVFHEIDWGVTDKNSADTIHPLARFVVTIAFIVTTISFSKYDLAGLTSMSLYIILQYMWYDISLKQAVQRIWPVLLLTCMAGIANPILERDAIFYLGNLCVTNGMISMLTLMLKGVLCVLASYLLVMTTGIYGICYSMKCIHLPQILITGLMLTYRYIIVLLKEAERMWISYKLRAPKQKGIKKSAWGSFVGLLLLRSMERGENVYESMLLRGYCGDYQLRNKQANIGRSIVFGICWCILFLGLRWIPVFHIVGSLF